MEQSLRAIQQSRAQVILRQREQRLFAMLRRQRLARQQILVNPDGALHLAAAAVQGAQREMGFDGVRIGVHELQEHVERPVGLLRDEIIEARKIIRVQFASGALGQRLPQPKCPASMPMMNAAMPTVHVIGEISGIRLSPRLSGACTRLLSRGLVDPRRR